MYLVCGEALFDVFLDREDGPGSLRFDARAGGSPFNVAIGIARLGGRSGLLAGVSTDMFGNRLVNLLESESVNTGYLCRSTRRTTLSIVALDDAGHADYVFYGQGSADCSLTESDIPPIGPEVTGFHFGSYSLVVRPVADAFAAVAANKGDRFVSVDPNVRPTVEPDLDVWRERVADYVGHADLVKASAEDLQYLYPGVNAENKASDWLDAGAQVVIVTDGSGHVRAWTRQGEAVQLPPPSLDVADTVGAGDSFQAALLARLATGQNPKRAVANLGNDKLKELLNFASRAAAVTCTRRGADLPYSRDLST